MKPFMTACEVAKYLLVSCRSLQEFQSYMFGSSLFGAGSDFDILVIGPAGEPLSRVKAELEMAGRELPLDILCMLPEEVEETKFFNKAECIPLIRLANMLEESSP